MTAQASSALTDALARLRDQLRATPLPLALPDRDRADHTCDELVGAIDDHMLPRLRNLDAPLLAVVGGSTGSGKSTLVNSLLGEEVSPSSVIRPTTRAPVLACAPADLDWFADERVLPGLPRLTGAAHQQQRALHLVPSPALQPGLALLDAPDIDSVVEANRELAGALLAAADLWLFVTTAARYADAVPWDFLHQARERSTALTVVLNRLPPEAAAEVPGHLEVMLADRGLQGTPVLTVAETELVDGLLPSEELFGVRAWLDDLTADAEARQQVVRQTLDGALDSLPARVEDVALAVEAQESTAASLRSDVRRAYDGASRDVADGLSDGSLLRGEVLARWQEFVGTGELMRSVEARVGALRDRLRSLVTGRPAPVTEVRVALESSIEALVVAAGDRAAERVEESWRTTPAGRGLLAAQPRLDRSSPQLAQWTAEEVRAWQAHVLELVSAEGADKRVTARFVSFGVNGLGVALMVAVFAHTGGLTGGEVAVAGGTAALGQKLLEAVFGDQAVRTLTTNARTDLLVRIDGLLAEEAARFDGVVDQAGLVPGQAAVLQAAVDEVRAARLSL